MERFGPGGNFPVKVVHLQRWSSLTGSTGRTENCRSIFRNFCFQSCSSSSLHTEVKIMKMADVDGRVCEVYQCSVCKLQTDDINALIMHSCTLGTGTVVHLNLKFVLVFISSLIRTNILLASPNVDDVFPRFSLRSM